MKKTFALSIAAVAVLVFCGLGFPAVPAFAQSPAVAQQASPDTSKETAAPKLGQTYSGDAISGFGKLPLEITIKSQSGAEVKGAYYITNNGPRATSYHNRYMPFTGKLDGTKLVTTPDPYGVSFDLTVSEKKLQGSITTPVLTSTVDLDRRK